MLKRETKLVALDLDGTLLNAQKELTGRTAAALQAAAERGIEIVPTTGRFFSGMPDAIRSLPFLHYAITINGAQVQNLQTGEILYRSEIPLAQAIGIMQYLDTLPVIYDCYMDNWGWMTRQLQQQAIDFAPDTHYLKMLLELRSPVDELKAFLEGRGQDVQKIQLFTNDPALRRAMLESFSQRFADTAVSSSVVNNLEINSSGANKGSALCALAKALSIPVAQTMAFGDGLNDVSMLRAAGTGVAMQNACPEAKACADVITASCDEDGVAVILEEILGL